MNITEVRRERRRAGLCTGCGKVESKRSRCPRCQALYEASQAKARERAAAAVEDMRRALETSR